MTWNRADIPDLDGRTAIVTGSNTGIGFETAAALAAAGARTVLACRDPDKGAAARAEITGRGVRVPVEVLQLDLASQSQIAGAANEVLDRFPSVDVLINNAGVMSDDRGETADGYELLFGTNYLGHFAFTGRILPAILAAPGARVVTVSSHAQKFGRIRWDDLHWTQKYKPNGAYAQSKLALTMFALAFQRRLAAAGVDAASLVAHPGFADTDIIRNRKREASRVERKLSERFVQTPAEASRSLLRAATDASAYGGEFYGPNHRLETHGDPVPVRPSRRAIDEHEQEQLWKVSIEHTGVEYHLPDRRPRASLQS